ncbi:MAG: polysaccharide deacetylase family protein [Clostridia bacterium]|nr:polysaccharide deacetylase family protein [Clostridia bacterium]
MKLGRIIISLLTLLTVLAMLFSCRIGGDGGADGDSGSSGGSGDSGAGDSSGGSTDSGSADGTHSGTLIYDRTSDLKLVLAKDVAGSDVTDIFNALQGKVKSVSMSDDRSEVAEHEIVFGQTDREISKTAYKRLSRIRTDDDAEFVLPRVLIYSDGSSVAVAYDEFELGYAEKYAIDYFYEHYVQDELYMKEGTQYREVVEIFDYIDALADIESAEAWAAVEKQVGKEISDALQDYYPLFQDNFIYWMANLYDPEIGGFYYSNSARDTEGYLPDIESTYQALTFMRTTGMTKGDGKTPSWLKEKVGAFIVGLQDKNGFFYHPQWGKELTDQKTSRRARDEKWATSLLKSFGITPKYTTPSGLVGFENATGGDSSLLPVSALTERLGGSATAAASKVIATSDTSSAVPSHLVSDETLRAYLATKNLATSSYNVANEISAQAGQFIARDKQLKDEGKTYSLIDITIDWFNEHQVAETGHYQTYTNYHAVNGLFKAVSFYKDVGREFPNAANAAISAMECMNSTEKVHHVCDIYNTWYTVNMLVDNIKKFNSEDEAKPILESVLDCAPTAIRVTLSKFAEFRKEDGSFGYYRTTSSATSQGMLAAVPNTNEGDINASEIAISTLGNIFISIGCRDLQPRRYNDGHFIKYIRTLESLGSIVKDELSNEVEPITFNDELVDSKPITPGITFVNGSTGGFMIRNDESDPDRGYFLELVSTTVKNGTRDSSNDNFTVAIQNQHPTAECSVLEADILVKSASGYFSQIVLGNRCYMLGLKVSGDRVNLIDSSSQSSPTYEQNLCASAKLGEWFNLRVEYYPADHYTTRAIVYIDGEVVAVSDNYYDHKGVKITQGVGEPDPWFGQIAFSVMSGYNATMCFDNIKCYKTEKDYEPVDADITVNADPYDRGTKTYNFNDGKIHSDLTLTENGTDSFTVVDGTDGKELSLTTVKTDSATSNILIPANIRGANTNCAVLETDISISSAANGDLLRLSLHDYQPQAGYMTGIILSVYTEGKEQFVTAKESGSGSAGGTLDSISVPVGEKFKLRVEYYHAERASLIYINGVLAAMSTAVSGDIKYYRFGQAKITPLAGGVGTVSLDNIKVEKIIKSFTEATTPEQDRITYTFDSGLEKGVGFVGGAKLSNKAAAIPAGGAITVPLNVRSEIYTVTRLIYKLDTAGKATEHRLNLLDSDGKCVIAYDAVSDGKTVSLYELTESGRKSRAIAVFPAKEAAELTFDYFHARGVVQIYRGDECIAVSSMRYSAKDDTGAIRSLSFSTVSGAQSSVDNVIFECVNEIFKAATPPEVDNPEDTASKITFEESFSSSIPSSVTTIHQSNGASTEIREVIRGEEKSNALVFTTKPGGNDEIVIGLTEIADENGNCYVFEADIAFNFALGGYSSDTFEIYFIDKDNTSKRAYLTTVSSSAATQNLYFKDYSANSQPRRDGSQYNSGYYDGLWAKLRIEYYVGDRDTTRIKVYLDDNLFVVSNNFYNSHDETKEIFNDISAIRFYAYGSAEAELMLDNVSFKKISRECADDAVGKHSIPAQVRPVEKKPGNYSAAFESVNWEVSEPWKLDDTNTAVTNPFITRGDESSRYLAGNTTYHDRGYAYCTLKSFSGNKALEFGQLLASVDDGSDTNIKGETRLYVYNKTFGGSVYVFESDVMLESCEGVADTDSPWVIQLGFNSGINAVYSADKTTVSPRDKDTFFGNAYIFDNGDGSYSLGYNKDNTYGESLEAGVFYNVCIEYYPEYSTVRYYIDGEFVGEHAFVPTQDTSELMFACLSINKNAANAKVYLDDTVCAAADIEYKGTADKNIAKVLPVKGGRHGIVVLMHDDGDLDTMTVLDRIYREHSLRADVALVADRVYNLAGGSVREAEVAKWQDYFESGYWNLVAHSMTHKWWGSTDTDGELTIDEALVKQEVEGAYEALVAAFGDTRLAYAYPGFDAYTSVWGKVECYAPAIEAVLEHYIGGRDCRFPKARKTVSYADIAYSMIYASSISKGADNLQKNLDSIDEAALSGTLAILFSHRVYDEANATEALTNDTSAVTSDYIESIAEKVAGYVNEGYIWNAFLEEAILYLKEAESATVTAVSGNNVITLTLTDSLDDEVYNYALTLEVTVPEEWAGVKVTQGENTSYSRAFEREGKWVVYIDAVPDGGEIILTPAEESALPEAPVLPCIHADSDGDGFCDECEREYHDQTTCVHKDEDGDGVCDKCEAEYHDQTTCVHKDADGDGVCDKCEAEYHDQATCKHKDEDIDYKCDKCEAVYYDPATCPHADADGSGVCDNCGTGYYDPETCPHVDTDIDRVCDNCETTYYDPETCEHVDEKPEGALDAICDNCGSVYYTEATCPAHADADGDGVCDVCSAEYHDQTTCKHKDRDGDGICDKCEAEYHDPVTCEHTDENGDEQCDKCGFGLGDSPVLGGTGSDEQGWLGKE